METLIRRRKTKIASVVELFKNGVRSLLFDTITTKYNAKTGAKLRMKFSRASLIGIFNSNPALVIS